jgi:hypothetical protein
MQTTFRPWYMQKDLAPLSQILNYVVMYCTHTPAPPYLLASISDTDTQSHIMIILGSWLAYALLSTSCNGEIIFALKFLQECS